MAAKLADYIEVVGRPQIEEIQRLATAVNTFAIHHINSTKTGGGVAEILSRLVPLLNELGVETYWDVIEGSPEFFEVTKTFHNALHGLPVALKDEFFDIYRDWTQRNLKQIKLKGDVIVIHDPQPAGFVEARDREGRFWVWRCHIDLSQPNARVWQFLRPYVERYDASIYSMPEFAQRLEKPQ